MVDDHSASVVCTLSVLATLTGLLLTIGPRTATTGLARLTAVTTVTTWTSIPVTLTPRTTTIATTGSVSVASRRSRSGSLRLFQFLCVSSLSRDSSLGERKIYETKRETRAKKTNCQETWKWITLRVPHRNPKFFIPCFCCQRQKQGVFFFAKRKKIFWKFLW